MSFARESPITSSRSQSPEVGRPSSPSSSFSSAEGSDISFFA